MDIFTKENSHLFHFTNIGYQSYFVHDHILASMEKMKFDCYKVKMSDLVLFMNSAFGLYRYNRKSWNDFVILKKKKRINL